VRIEVDEVGVPALRFGEQKNEKLSVNYFVAC
jgi:hypothetical protein